MTSLLPNLPEFPANPPKEPSLAVGTTTGTIGGLLSLALVLFPDMLTEKQTTIILVVGAFILPIITAIATRGRVWSPHSVKELIDTSINDAIKELGKTKNPYSGTIKHPDKSEFFKKP